MKRKTKIALSQAAMGITHLPIDIEKIPKIMATTNQT
jgi:hypothetical protein